MPRFHTRSARANGVPVDNKETRRGTIVVFSAFLMICMMAMLAFSVDLGYIYTTQAELQRSVDAAALAGAGGLVDGQDEANSRVV